MNGTWNSLILKMWVQKKIKNLERELEVCNTAEDAFRIHGKLDVLEEFFDDFNLVNVDEKDIIIHNNF